MTAPSAPAGFTAYPGGGFALAGASTVSEWLSPIRGFIKTCVEASEAVITGVYKVLPTTPGTTTQLAEDQIARGEAGALGGASNYASAGAQLARLGIPNTVLAPGWVRNPANSWVAAVNKALSRGVPVLVGVPNASALTDSVSGARPDAGVRGHGLAIVGATAHDYLVADPNTAPGSGLMHYSPASFAAAGIDSLVIPNDAPAAVHPVAQASGGGSLSNPLGFIYGGSSVSAPPTSPAPSGGNGVINAIQAVLAGNAATASSLADQNAQHPIASALFGQVGGTYGQVLDTAFMQIAVRVGLVIGGIIVIAVALHALLNPGGPTIIGQVARSRITGAAYTRGARAAAAKG